MIKVGITGGIGSGKSTVCKVFEVLNIPIYYADDRAKWLMQHDKKLIEGVKQLLGPSSYLKDGNLDRKYIASIIFNDKDKLAKMNALVHPAVWLDGEKWNEAHKDSPYTLKEAALLFESGGYQLMDKMICVYTPKEVRIKRVIERDQSNKEEVLARMDKQMLDEEKMKLSDFIIHNYGTHSLIDQVIEIHRQLIQ